MGTPFQAGDPLAVSEPLAQLFFSFFFFFHFFGAGEGVVRSEHACVGVKHWKRRGWNHLFDQKLFVSLRTRTVPIFARRCIECGRREIRFSRALSYAYFDQKDELDIILFYKLYSGLYGENAWRYFVQNHVSRWLWWKPKSHTWIAPIFQPSRGLVHEVKIHWKSAVICKNR